MTEDESKRDGLAAGERGGFGFPADVLAQLEPGKWHDVSVTHRAGADPEYSIKPSGAPMKAVQIAVVR